MQSVTVSVRIQSRDRHEIHLNREISYLLEESNYKGIKRTLKKTLELREII